MADRVWDRYLTEQDRAHVEMHPAARKGVGRRPALLLVDLYRDAFGDEPEPLLDAVRSWPSSCGLAGWASLPHIERILATARELMVPVAYVTGQEKLPGWRDATPRGGGHGDDAAARDRRRRRYDIVTELSPIEGEYVLGKIAPSAFFGTPLVSILNQLRVDTILVCGETTSGCVRSTVVDGRSYRYQVIVPEECVFDRHEATHALNLFDMDQKYADVMPTDDAIRYLRGVAAVAEQPEPAMAAASR